MIKLSRDNAVVGFCIKNNLVLEVYFNRSKFNLFKLDVMLVVSDTGDAAGWIYLIDDDSYRECIGNDISDCINSDETNNVRNAENIHDRGLEFDFKTMTYIIMSEQTPIKFELT